MVDSQMVNLVTALENHLYHGHPIDDVAEALKPLDDFHNLWHCVSDSDIRAKDSVYAEMQHAEMEKFLNAMKLRDYEKARRITFIAST